jgi:mono/diheme cytochrome c family protein
MHRTPRDFPMTPTIKAAALMTVMAFAPAAASAQSMPPKGQIIGQETFPEQGGPALYKAICQGCHMPDGMGASGAGKYPALAKNPKLAAAGYPILRVLKGQGAMPPFMSNLNDQQVADVVTYVRTNFGNAYPAPVTAAQVKALR